MNEASCPRRDVTVHMIGNAHLDPVWLWRWTEGFEAAVGTFRTVLDLMRETDAFTFTCAQAAVYEWIERYEPEMFEEIRQRVRERRWEVVGGWWVQPDCNIPCGESFVRQALYGQRYFRQKFGVEATVGYNVDSFGHAPTLPQLLRKAGLNSYVFFRPGAHEKELPESIFWWEAPDGSRVLACRPPGHYLHAEDDVTERIRDHAARVVEGVGDVASFYGVGNHGGGPTRRQVAGILAAQDDARAPRVVFGRLDGFFERVRGQREDFPVVREDLQHHAVGCYTSHAAVKRWNRESEAFLGTSEAFCALAAELGEAPYPGEELRKAWQNVLFNQFHDILPGTSLPEAYEDVRDLYGESRALARRALLGATQALARRVDTRGEGQAVLVFNPLPWHHRGTLEVRNPFGMVFPSHVEDAEGRAVASQPVHDRCLSAARSMKHLWLDELPPLGYRLFFVRPGEGAAAAPEGLLEVSQTHLENDHLRLEIDPRAGHVNSLLDKEHGGEVFDGPAAAALVIQDEYDTWAHGASEFRDVVGRFGEAEVTVEEPGPVRAALRVVTRYGDSTMTQLFRLCRGSRRIEVAAEIDWREQFRMLKLAFPVAVEEPLVTASAPYGHIVREPNGAEEPCGPWVDVSGTAAVEGGKLPYGLAVITDSKHGYDCLGSELRLSVLRGPVYAWSEWDVTQPRKDAAEHRCLFQDQGRSGLRYVLVPHAGPWQDAGVVREAFAINRPPFSVNEFPHPGDGPSSWRGVEVGPENVILSALKRAEDGRDLILRLWEAAGRECEAQVHVHGCDTEWRGPMGANEVKTLRLRTEEGRPSWQETNLLERVGDEHRHCPRPGARNVT